MLFKTKCSNIFLLYLFINKIRQNLQIVYLTSTAVICILLELCYFGPFLAPK